MPGCIFGYCEHKFINMVVVSIKIVALEFIKFLLLLLLAFWLATGIFQWWDQSVSPAFISTAPKAVKTAPSTVKSKPCVRDQTMIEKMEICAACGYVANLPCPTVSKTEMDVKGYVATEKNATPIVSKTVMDVKECANVATEKMPCPTVSKTAMDVRAVCSTTKQVESQDSIQHTSRQKLESKSSQTNCNGPDINEIYASLLKRQESIDRRMNELKALTECTKIREINILSQSSIAQPPPSQLSSPCMPQAQPCNNAPMPPPPMPQPQAQGQPCQPCMPQTQAPMPQPQPQIQQFCTPLGTTPLIEPLLPTAAPELIPQCPQKKNPDEVSLITVYSVAILDNKETPSKEMVLDPDEDINATATMPAEQQPTVSAAMTDEPQAQPQPAPSNQQLPKAEPSKPILKVESAISKPTTSGPALPHERPPPEKIKMLSKVCGCRNPKCGNRRRQPSL